MRITKLLLLAFLGAQIPGEVGAYELGTHAVITQKAVEKSVLADPKFQQGLGLNDGIEIFGKNYLDISGADVKVRDGFDFEKSFMPKGSMEYSISGWLMRGAIREDDLGQILGMNVGDDPHDDPYGSIFRVFNHFYDPAQDRPLTTKAGVLGMRSPDWGVGSINAFTQPKTPDPNRRNHFTVFDAREAMFCALTGRDVVGNTVALTEAERKEYWATTFRALGDAVHLVQDMGQPQHTRNDAHSGVLGFGHKSVFEEYIEMRATGADSYNIDGTNVTPPPLTYDGYPIPTFTKYSDFWSTRNGAGGRGLSDYSNRGFFSVGTNLGSNVYNFPSNNDANYVKESSAGLLPKKPFQTISFLRGNVHDANLNVDASTRMTTESLFDAFLFDFKTYSLNRYNYDDMAGQLIPRAVAYSAGLINYFFRGKIEYKPDVNNPGKYLIRNLGAEDMKGTFTLYYDAKDGKRYPVAGDMPTATWGNRAIVANGELGNLGFTIPVNPVPKIPGVYVLVFNGDMGEEGVVPGVTVGALAARVVYVPAAKVRRDHELTALTHQINGCNGEKVPEVASRYLVPESNYNVASRDYYSWRRAIDVCNLAFRVAANEASCAKTEYGKLLWSTWKWTGEFGIYGDADSYFYGSFSAYFYADVLPGDLYASYVNCESSYMLPNGPSADKDGEYLLGVSGLLLKHRSCPPGYGESDVNYDECVLVDPELVRRAPGSKCTLRWSPTANTWDKDSLDPNCIGEP